MADVKINDLAAISAPASTDVLPIVDVSLDTTNKISVSSILKTVPDGTASAPAIAFEGDSNTGIYHPASEEISFATSGTQRLTIRSDGKVGIGTSNPTQVLEVAGTVKATNFEGGSSGMTINSDDVTEGSTNLFSQWDNVTGGINYASGNVGVGTTIPAYKLDLKDADALAVVAKLAEGADANYELVAANGSGTDADGNEVARFGVQYKGTGWNSFLSYIRGNGAQTGSISVNTSNAERVVIDDDGNIGIGTNTPGQKVEIKSSNARLKITDSDTTAATSTSYIEFSGSDARSAVIFTDSSGFNFQTDTEGANEFRFITGGADERIRIKTDGKVGIGTDSPVGTAHLKAATPVATFQPTADTQEGQINFINTTGTFKGRVGYAYDTDSLELYTDGSQQVTVDSDGKVGIGTSTPTSLLNLKSTTAEVLQTLETSTGTVKLYANNDDFIVDADQHKFRSEDGSTEYVRIRETGNVGIGTSSPSQKLTIRSTASDQLRIEDNAGDGFNVVRDTTTGFLDFDGTQETFSGFSFSTTPTGGNLTERLTILNNGNVGIGTTSPGAGLHIVSDGQATSAIDTSSDINALVTDDGTSVGNGGSLVFGAASGVWRFAAIKGIVSNGSDNTVGSLAFSTRRNLTDSTLTEAMRIAIDGSVGIGTSSPQHTFDVESPNSNTDETVAAFGNQTIQGGLEIITNGNLDWGFNAKNTRNLVFETNQTERLRVDSNGKVLVGTSTAINNGGLNPVLQIADNSANAAFSFTRYTSNANGPAVVLAKSRTGVLGAVEAVTSGTELGKFIFAGADVTTTGDLATKGAEIRCTVQGSVAANSVPARLGFFVRDDGNTDNNPVERFRINNDGELQATTGNTTITELSDQRLKRNINDFTYDIEQFKKYQPRTYDWINPSLHDEKSQCVGFVAQEVEEIDSQWIGESVLDPETSDSELIGADLIAKTSGLSEKDAMYISVIQQLISKIETLEQRLSDAGL